MKIKLRRNKHNLSHYRLGTCAPGELIPVGLVEVCPGDTFQHQASAFIRMLPMNAPIIHRAQVRLHSFFVPFRILWSGWEDFITRQEGADSVPTTNINDWNQDAQRLADYLGLNTYNYAGSTQSLVSTLAFAAYNMTFNEWYRDQDLVAPLVQDAANMDATTDFVVQRVAWQKDYFTSARPWPQKGPDITLPLGVSAPLIATGTGAPTFTVEGDPGGAGALFRNVNSTDVQQGTSTNDAEALVWANPALEADLSEATAVNVNEVRKAFSLQRLAERLSQFGSRYPELLASMGVKSSDARLQRPEYLGGGKVPISFSEVLQTAEGSTTPVGELRGHAIAPGSTRPYRRFFEEHGYVITLMSIRPQAVYSDVMPRTFIHGLVDGANDFYTPELERIGQQEILYKEVQLRGDDEGDEVVWGYQDRYSEFRHQPSQVSGLLRVGESLDHWTWARGFAQDPTPVAALNETFITCDPRSDVFAQSTTDNVIFGVNHKLIAQRMLTKNVIGRIM